MICKNCGHNLAGEFNNFCDNCGVSQTQQIINPVPGRKLLNITGILIIIFASLAILLSLSMLFSIDDWIVNWHGSRLAWQIEYAIFIFIGVYGLFVGIMGIYNRENIEKARLLQVLAIINIILLAFFRFVLTSILGTYAMEVDGNAASALLGILLLSIENLVLVLYLVGALKNKKERGVIHNG